MKRLNDYWGEQKELQKTLEITKYTTDAEVVENKKEVNSINGKVLATAVTAGVITFIGTLLYAGAKEPESKIQSNHVEKKATMPSSPEKLLIEFHHRISLILSKVTDSSCKSKTLHHSFEKFQEDCTPEEWEQMIYFFQKQDALLDANPFSEKTLTELIQKKDLTAQEVKQFGRLLWQKNTMITEQK